MCLARNIKYLRKKHHYSQEYIAHKLGYKSFTTIQKWESGIAEPSVLVLRKLADLFGVDMNDMTTVDIEHAELHHEIDPYSEARSLFSQLDSDDQETVVIFMRNMLEKSKYQKKNKSDQVG